MKYFGLIFYQLQSHLSLFMQFIICRGMAEFFKKFKTVYFWLFCWFFQGFLLSRTRNCNKLKKWAKKPVKMSEFWKNLVKILYYQLILFLRGIIVYEYSFLKTLSERLAIDNSCTSVFVVSQNTDLYESYFSLCP